MSLVYLKKGEEVILHEKLENGYIIERMISLYDHLDEGEVSEPCGVKEVVDEIFLSPPVQKYSDDLTNILEMIQSSGEELSKIYEELAKANRELVSVKNTKTDLSKMIVNRSELINAERLTVFSDFKSYDIKKGSVMKDVSIQFQVDVRGGDIKEWVCEIHGDGFRSSYENINMEYGILINATDEQILEIGRKMVAKIKDIPDSALINQIPHEYLSEELLARKTVLIKNRREKMIANLESEISSRKEEINKIKSLINPKDNEGSGSL